MFDENQMPQPKFLMKIVHQFKALSKQKAVPIVNTGKANMK